MKNENVRYDTKIIHGGQSADPLTGALSAPIYQTSTFVFEKAEDSLGILNETQPGYIYTRVGNPTQAQLEKKIAILEGGEAGLAFASGVGAVATTILTLFSQGDHIVAANSLYGSTYSLLSHHCKRFGIETTFVDATDSENIKKAIQPNTKLVYIESPSNPTLRLVDIKKAAEYAHENGALLAIDSTFMSPIGQKPLTMGADIVIHSATKYLGGHGDVIAGLVVSTKEIIYKLRREGVMDITGACIGPFDAWLVLRGIKTLGVRTERIVQNAQKIAEFLETHPMIQKVFYPGLPSHPQHELAKEQMSHFGGVITFEVKGGVDGGRTLMNNVGVCSLAVSLGDVDTLIEHPASMTHAQMSVEEQLRTGISDGLVRLSVGLEDPQDIIDDLTQALDKIVL